METTTHARALTLYVHNQTYLLYLVLEDRILELITGTIQDLIGDGHITFQLWLHAREAADFSCGPSPGEYTSSESRILMLVGSVLTSKRHQSSYTSFSSSADINIHINFFLFSPFPVLVFCIHSINVVAVILLAVFRFFVFFLKLQGRFLCDNHVDCIDIITPATREIIFNCFAS